jgi:predicted HicB family RNase H-like nuclease
MMTKESRKIVEVFEEDGLEITRYDDGTRDVAFEVPDELHELLLQKAKTKGVSVDELILQTLQEAVCLARSR